MKSSVEELVRKLNRSPRAIQSVLLRIREIRADQFSLESLSAALHVSKREILTWIDRGWLPAKLVEGNGRKLYTITPEDLQYMYKHYQQDILWRGRSNLLLFAGIRAVLSFTQAHNRITSPRCAPRQAGKESV